MSPGARLSLRRPVEIPRSRDTALLGFGSRQVALTNLRKTFWPRLGYTKRDLLQYYADVSAVLLPHIRGRAMVMKRYPNGAEDDYFYMKRAPWPRPGWIRTCGILHRQAGLVDYPIVDDLPGLLWMINLGCIDLNPWYADCADFNRPDVLHFDLDPGPGAGFARLREVALLVRRYLARFGIDCHAKTTGSRGIHVYVPIEVGPYQKEVWTYAKAIAFELAATYPKIITAEYRISRRPFGRVVVDYNQNAWGRTLASVYSVRPSPEASVSAPVSWEEIERGIEISDFRMDNMVERIRAKGDLWKPLLSSRRVALGEVFLPPIVGLRLERRRRARAA